MKVEGEERNAEHKVDTITRGRGRIELEWGKYKHTSKMFYLPVRTMERWWHQLIPQTQEHPELRSRSILT